MCKDITQQYLFVLGTDIMVNKDTTIFHKKCNLKYSLPQVGSKMTPIKINVFLQ